MENEEKRISSYLRDILSGRPVADIPRCLILKVHETFIRNRGKLNINNSKYVQIIHDFENIEKRFGINKKESKIFITSQTQPSIITKKAYTSDEENAKIYERNEIETIVDGLINGNSFESIETESIEYIIEYLKQKIDQLVKESELDEASTHQDLLDKMIELSYERKYLTLMMTKKKGINRNAEFFKQKIEEEKKKLETENQKIDEETSYLLQHEEEKMTKLLLQFDNETDQGPPSKSIKLSPKLLNLKQVEKFLIKSKRFKEASKIHEVLSQLEEKEMNNNLQNFMDERKNKKDQLMLFYQSQIQNIQLHANRRKAAIEKRSQTVIDSLNNAIKNIMAKEKDINNLINDEKNIQNEEINSNTQTIKNASQIKKKKKKVQPKKTQTDKIEKRVHFDESIFK